MIRRGRKGFIMLGAMMILSVAMTLGVVGLGRATTEMLAAQRFAQAHQAFYLAEAGLDEALVRLAGDPYLPSEITALLNGPDGVAGTADDGQLLDCTQGPGADGIVGTADDVNYCPSLGSYQARVRDDNADPAQLDHVVILDLQGAGGAATKTLHVTVELPGAPPRAFDYGANAEILKIRDHVVIGDLLEGPSPIYIAGYRWGGWWAPTLETQLSNTVHTEHIDFVSPFDEPLAQQCPNCGNPSVFPPPVQFEMKAEELPPVELDLNPYYAKALEQCVAEGQALADCTDGSAVASGSYHHITADTTLPSGTYEGVIYVESSVTLTLGDDVTINGTIVHEGSSFGWEASGLTWYPGFIRAAPGANISIDSYASTDIDNDGVPETPFAAGIAVAGAPIVQWGEWDAGGAPQPAMLGGGSGVNPGIKGFVMMANYYDEQTNRIIANGVIDGGVIGVWGEPKGSDDFYDWNAVPRGQLGPGPDPIYYFTAFVRLGGNTKVWYDRPPVVPPGFTSRNLGPKPAILAWTAD